MEQNMYKTKYSIILLLTRKKSHLRGISKELGINHMNVKRALDKLYEDNMVDFVIEGKNKVYFLKRSIESRAETISAEINAQMNFIQKYPVMRQIFEKIILNKNIDLAILFGSYSKDSAHKKSDIDIYIESENPELKKDIEKINSKINVKTGKFDKEDLLIKEIINSHIIIKGFEKYYEKAN